MKEKQSLTCDLPVVKVCLVLLAWGQRPGSVGFPGCVSEKTQKRKWELHCVGTSEAPLRLHLQIGTGLQRADRPSRGAHAILNWCTRGAQCRFSLHSEEKSLHKVLSRHPLCDVSWFHCPWLGVMLTHKYKGDGKWVYLPFLASRIKGGLCQQDPEGELCVSWFI